MQLTLTKEKIQEINEKMDINSFVYLWSKYYELDIKFSDDSNIAIPLIIKNFLLPSGNISPNGKKLIEEITEMSNKIDNNYNLLYEELSNKMIELTGKKQAKANGGYSFFPNFIDFKNKLYKIIHKYQLKDWGKIRNLLLLHIKNSYSKKWDKVMLLQYYIEKNGMSTLASDYENYNEIDQKEEVKEISTKINIKELF